MAETPEGASSPSSLPARKRSSLLPSWRWPRSPFSGKTGTPTSSPSNRRSGSRFFQWSTRRVGNGDSPGNQSPATSVLSIGRAGVEAYQVGVGVPRCPICMEPLPPDGGVAFGCPHELCNGCLWRWINEERFVGEDLPTCPICRVCFGDDPAFGAFIQALDDRVGPFEGLPLLDACVSQVPRFAAAHAMRGNFLDFLQRPAEAAEACEQALKLHPADEFSPVFLLSAHRAQGSPDHAVPGLMAALMSAPSNRSAELCVGRALLLARRYDEAEKALEVLARRTPLHGHDDASFAAWLFLYEYYDEVIYDFDRAQEAAGGAAEAFQRLSPECQDARRDALASLRIG